MYLIYFFIKAHKEKEFLWFVSLTTVNTAFGTASYFNLLEKKSGAIAPQIFMNRASLWPGSNAFPRG